MITKERLVELEQIIKDSNGNFTFIRGAAPYINFAQDFNKISSNQELAYLSFRGLNHKILKKAEKFNHNYAPILNDTLMAKLEIFNVQANRFDTIIKQNSHLTTSNQNNTPTLRTILSRKLAEHLDFSLSYISIHKDSPWFTSELNSLNNSIKDNDELTVLLTNIKPELILKTEEKFLKNKLKNICNQKLNEQEYFTDIRGLGHVDNNEQRRYADTLINECILNFPQLLSDKELVETVLNSQSIEAGTKELFLVTADLHNNHIEKFNEYLSAGFKKGQSAETIYQDRINEGLADKKEINLIETQMKELNSKLLYFNPRKVDEHWEEMENLNLRERCILSNVIVNCYYKEAAELLVNFYKYNNLTTKVGDMTTELLKVNDTAFKLSKQKHAGDLLEFLRDLNPKQAKILENYYSEFNCVETEPFGKIAELSYLHDTLTKLQRGKMPDDNQLLENLLSYSLIKHPSIFDWTVLNHTSGSPGFNKDAWNSLLKCPYDVRSNLTGIAEYNRVIEARNYQKNGAGIINHRTGKEDQANRTEDQLTI